MKYLKNVISYEAWTATKLLSYLEVENYPCQWNVVNYFKTVKMSLLKVFLKAFISIFTFDTTGLF